MKNKDYEKQGEMHPDFPESEDEWGGKLKTLKDIKIEGSNGRIRLRAEAVKWVKYYFERNCEMGGLRGNWEASWIKHFFNLTEEDLK